MLRILVSIILVSFVFAIPARTQVTDKNKEKLRQSATKIAAEGDRTAEVQFKSGEKRKGQISAVGNDSFTFVDAKSGQSQTIDFSDVTQIKKQKKGLGLGAWIAIGAAATTAIIVTVLLRSIYCNEQAC